MPHIRTGSAYPANKILRLLGVDVLLTDGNTVRGMVRYGNEARFETVVVDTKEETFLWIRTESRFVPQDITVENIIYFASQPLDDSDDWTRYSLNVKRYLSPPTLDDSDDGARYSLHVNP